MTFSLKPAYRTNQRLIIGLCGPSGSGKTKSALELAVGIVGITGTIIGIDTEEERMLEYAPPHGLTEDQLRAGLAAGRFYNFLHMPFRDPFSPGRYKEAIGVAIQESAKIGKEMPVIIIDSTSHMHEGPGGMLAMHDEILTRMAGTDYKRREKLNGAAWIEPKHEFHEFLYWVLRQRAHFIFCFRARKKVGFIKVEGKMQVVDRGLVPISTEGFDYEMTARIMLPHGAKGVPSDDPEFTKINDPVKHIFKEGESLSRKVGAALRQWAMAQPNSDTQAPTDQATSGIFIEQAGGRSPCANIEEWVRRMIAGIDKSRPDQVENILDRNTVNMDDYDGSWPEQVATVRKAFEEKIGRSR